MNSNRSSKLNLPNVPKPSKLLAPTRLRQTYFFSNFPDSATWPWYQPMWNWFLPNCFPKHQTALSQKWIWWENVLVISFLRIWQWRERELRNLKSLLMKIGDELILFFSRVFLSKFSLEALYIPWVWGIFILGWKWNLKSQVLQNRAGSRLDWVASSSREVTERPIVLFCLVVL